MCRMPLRCDCMAVQHRSRAGCGFAVEETRRVARWSREGVIGRHSEMRLAIPRTLPAGRWLVSVRAFSSPPVLTPHSSSTSPFFSLFPTTMSSVMVTARHAHSHPSHFPPVASSRLAMPSAKDEEPPDYPPYSYIQLSPNMSLRYFTDFDAAEEFLNLCDLKGPLGFDLEWRPNFIKGGCPVRVSSTAQAHIFQGGTENPVALVQLADTNANIVVLVQVSAMSSTLSPPLFCRHVPHPSSSLPAQAQRHPRRPLDRQNRRGHTECVFWSIPCAPDLPADPRPDDCKKLFRDWGVCTRGCVDLSLLARSVDSQWKGKFTNPLGLARLVESYKRLAMDKAKRIQMSDWSAPLSPRQQECKHIFINALSDELIGTHRRGE